jgi:peptidoglycan/xylan/chitin deacetylase (PgdA/CDA1 family)
VDILNKENVQGLFFWQTNLVNDIEPYEYFMETGHQLGSHAHSHRILTELSFEEQYAEIMNSKVKLEDKIGRSIHWFRPPYGLYNEDTMLILNQLQMKMILWQIASWDWMHQQDEEKIIENVLNNVSPGDIVLLHELPQTVKILPKLIQGIREKGYILSKPHEILNFKKVDFKTGHFIT